MRAGQLHERVDIQYKTVTQNDYGEEVIVWATLAASVPADIYPLRGEELLIARQAEAFADVRIRIRYLETVQPTMRVVWGSHIYQIVAPPIHVGMRRRETQLMCREEVNA